MQVNWFPLSALQGINAEDNHALVSDMMNGIHGYSWSKIWKAQIQYDIESTNKALDYAKLYVFSRELSKQFFCKIW